MVKCDIVTLFCTRSQFTAGMSVCGHTLQHAIFFASLEWRTQSLPKGGLQSGGCTRKAAGVATESRCRAATAVRSQGQDFTLLDSEWGSIFTLCSRCRTHRTRSHCTVDGQGCSEPNAASAGTDRRHVQMLLVSLKPHRVVLALNKRSLDFLSRSSASD